MPSSLTLPHLLMTDCLAPEVNPSRSKSSPRGLGPRGRLLSRGGGARGSLSEGVIQGSGAGTTTGGPLYANLGSYARGGGGAQAGWIPSVKCLTSSFPALGTGSPPRSVAVYVGPEGCTPGVIKLPQSITETASQYN